MEHTKFNFQSLEALEKRVEELGVEIPLSEHLDVLKKPVSIGKKTVANRIAFQPMEGCDGTADGSPAELTQRRYGRFARGGAGLIWFEAVAVAQEARANPRQLYLRENNQEDFAQIVHMVKETCLKENGFEPVVILQATHSGRYSKPHGTPEPIIAYNNPLFEKENPIPAERIITDERLRRLEQKMGNTAKLAERAGFDGVDIKACHRYLNSELLSGYTRKGEYGGSFENRTRFYRNALQSAQANTSSDFIVTTRLNIYDGFPYPYGFGVNEKDGLVPDLSEPLKLVEILHRQMGLRLLDITIGNPYVNPHVNRPYDSGPYVPEESPLEGVGRMYSLTGRIQRAFPDLAVVSSGLSYLRQFSANLAAGAVEQGYTTLAGFGREAFAYPDFPKELLNNRTMDSKKCCIACGKCSEMMRAGTVAGCVVRDGETYLPIYQRDVLKKLGKH